MLLWMRRICFAPKIAFVLSYHQLDIGPRSTERLHTIVHVFTTANIIPLCVQAVCHRNAGALVEFYVKEACCFVWRRRPLAHTTWIRCLKAGPPLSSPSPLRFRLPCFSLHNNRAGTTSKGCTPHICNDLLLDHLQIDHDLDHLAVPRLPL